MILIADSGSSKTDWRVIHQDGSISQFRGVGFNPYYQTSEDMEKEMHQEFLLEIATETKEIYFYGAGCSSENRKSEVSRALATVFPHADITIDHDLAAAAHATCGHEPGIACILGTGSNSCDFDGEKIVATRPAPGFILGDEGGGAYVGKKLLQDFIYDDMPSDIRELFVKEFGLTQEVIQEHIYQKPYPNRYMASFCKFIAEQSKHPYCFSLFYNSFIDFFERHIFRYKDFKNKPVNFVGSIAFYNSTILRKAAYDQGLNIQKIIENPIAGLTLYHQNKL